MAEQLAFQQRLGQGGAVEADERPFLPRAGVVHGAGDQLLADAAFAADQHGRPAGGGAGDLLLHVGQHGAASRRARFRRRAACGAAGFRCASGSGFRPAPAAWPDCGMARATLSATASVNSRSSGSGTRSALGRIEMDQADHLAVLADRGADRAGRVKLAFAVLGGELAVPFDVAGQHRFAVAEHGRREKARRLMVGRLDDRSARRRPATRPGQFAVCRRAARAAPRRHRRACSRTGR